MEESAFVYLPRYMAGEHREVWDELRALGEKVHEPGVVKDARAVAMATMKRFGENVLHIAQVLERAGYTLAEKHAVKGARRDAGVDLTELATLTGPLPIALEAFYTLFDGVSLAQDVDAMVDDSPLFGPGVLDELGRNDPLVVAPLATVLADAAVSATRVYVAPDPLCKGTIDDEMPDENPARVVLPDAGMDARLEGGGSGYFVDWLRRYVEAGGFLGGLDDADRAHLVEGLQPF